MRSGVAFSLLLTLAAPGCLAEDTAEREAREAELGAMREHIEALSARMAESRAARDDLLAGLQAIELQAAELAGEMRRLDHALAAAEGRLAALTVERQTREGELRAQREALAGEVRAAYVIAQRGYLPLLLNQQDPARVARALTYHRYLQQAHGERIEAIRARLAQIAGLEQAAAQERETLRAVQVEKTRAQALVGAQRLARAEVLSRLQAELRSADAEVQRLTENARALEGVVERLRLGLSDIAEGEGPGRPFAEMKGALPWPARGRVRASFGGPRPGGLSWQGVVISAEAGSPVQAVHHGRVAFADWLRGLGLLVIIDHGEGFMTLYGHNQSLLCRVGDWVDAGEAVATAGDTGGMAQAGVYFELRLRGTPVNPAQWCRGSPARG